MISYHRWFLDRIATYLLGIEEESKLAFYEGKFHEYENDKKWRLGAEDANPHSQRYKTLMQ
ncbi:MAG: hypothetical protein ABI777_08725 [Betaproteobacteria bacterium]